MGNRPPSPHEPERLIFYSMPLGACESHAIRVCCAASDESLRKSPTGLAQNLVSMSMTIERSIAMRGRTTADLQATAGERRFRQSSPRRRPHYVLL